MALETLKGVKEIGGVKVIHNKLIKPIDGGYYIEVDNKRNNITFCLQDGPIKENGVNGAQIDVLAHTLKLIVEGFNKNVPSEFNERAIKGLDDCLQAFADRKADRELRNVEGLNLK